LLRKSWASYLGDLWLDKVGEEDGLQWVKERSGGLGSKGAIESKTERRRDKTERLEIKTRKIICIFLSLDFLSLSLETALVIRYMIYGNLFIL